MTSSSPAVVSLGQYRITLTETGSLRIHEDDPEAVAVVAVHDGSLVVVRQHRQAVGQLTYELPGGGVNPGEDLVAAARRELREETGLGCGALTRLGRVHSHACLINRAVTIYFTDEILSKDSQQLDIDEDIEVLFVPLDEVLHGVASGKWMDTEMAHGLLLAQLQGFIPSYRQR